jgi:hypothetical protein
MGTILAARAKGGIANAVRSTIANAEFESVFMIVSFLSDNALNTQWTENEESFALEFLPLIPPIESNTAIDQVGAL